MANSRRRFIKGLCVDFSNGSVDFSRVSQRTLEIIQFLVSNPGPQNARFMADKLKQPYKSLHKTLSRLVEKGVVLRSSRGFYELNHEFFCDPSNLSTYSRGGVGVGGFYRDVLMLHGFGIGVRVPGLLDKMLVVADLLECDLKNIDGYYRGRSLVFDADLRLFRDSAYYLRGSRPIPFRNVMFSYEDLIKSLAYHTRGLAEPCDGVLKNYELGLDLPSIYLTDVSRFLIYPKRKPARTRVHVQYSKERLLPLGPNGEREANQDFLKTLDEAERVISHTRRKFGIRDEFSWRIDIRDLRPKLRL